MSAAARVVHLHTPLTPRVTESLRIGDRVRLSGVVYTARDAAHERLVGTLQRGDELPFPLEGQVLYYAAPAPARPGAVIGPVGPTTAARVDPYTPALLAGGLKGTIGKGSRSKAVRQALQASSALYFVTVGGAAALLAGRVRAVHLVAYEDLGAEAVLRLEVEDLPLLVANDALGGDLFEVARAAYRRVES